MHGKLGFLGYILYIYVFEWFERLKIKVMTSTEVKNFRSDFQNAVAQLQKKYGVNISTGTIRYTDSELRFKVTARKGKVVEKLDKSAFNVGEKVIINHKSCKGKIYEVIKVMTKNIKVKEVGGLSFGYTTVSPGLLQKA